MASVGVLGNFADVLKSAHAWTAVRQVDYDKANAALQTIFASPASGNAEVDRLREALAEACGEIDPYLNGIENDRLAEILKLAGLDPNG